MKPNEIAQACAEKMARDDACSNALGIQIVQVRPGAATLTMVVRQDMVNGLHTCHGGIIFSLAL